MWANIILSTNKHLNSSPTQLLYMPPQLLYTQETILSLAS